MSATKAYIRINTQHPSKDMAIKRLNDITQLITANKNTRQIKAPTKSNQDIWHTLIEIDIRQGLWELIVKQISAYVAINPREIPNGVKLQVILNTPSVAMQMMDNPMQLTLKQKKLLNQIIKYRL